MPKAVEEAWDYTSTVRSVSGGLAQLARALAWHARGHRFEPDILHISPERREKRSLTY